RLRRIQQLAWNAARIAARLGGERDLPDAGNDLVIGCLHLGGGPRLEHRIPPVSHTHSHLLPDAVVIAVVGKGGVVADWTAHSGRRIAPFAAAEPGKTGRGK